MDIDEFYDGDARRRPSAELELGGEWRDTHGVRYELNYVEDTGELYIMREPVPHESADPFGGVHVSTRPGFDHKMTVQVVALIPDVPSVHRILDGWPDAMAADDGVEWLADRLRSEGVAAAEGPGDG